MKLPIKFRWKDIHNETVYDILRAEFGGLCLSSTKAYHGEMNEKTFSQLVGYDKNGKEIYSDDKIRVKDWNRYCLAGTGIEIAGDFFKVNDIGKTFDNVELVEESGNNDEVQ